MSFLDNGPIRIYKANPNGLQWDTPGAPPWVIGVPPPIQSGTLTRLRMRAAYSPVDPGGFTWPPPDSTWAPLPDQPSVNYVDFYTPGDSMRTVCTKIQSFCTARGTGYDGYRQVVLPNGFDEEIADFTMTTSKFGLYFDRFLGFIGQGENNTRFGMKRMSSTVGSGGTIMRLAGSFTNGVPNPLPVYPVTGQPLKVINYGYTIYGTEQPEQTYAQTSTPGVPEVGPQLFSGVTHYGNIGAITQRIRHKGTSCGNWNAPPGETFSVNSYKCVNSTWRGVEVDGYDPDGNRWGGSCFGGNNSDGDFLSHYWGHHGYVSGMTWSFAGSDTNINAVSKNFHTEYLRVEHQSNIAPRRSGKFFAIINNENCFGTILHEHAQLFVDNAVAPNQWAWNANHSSIVSRLGDNPTITYKLDSIDDYTKVHPRWSNALVLVRSNDYNNSGHQDQVTAPEVWLAGNKLTAINWTSQSNGTPPVINPLVNYFWVIS